MKTTNVDTECSACDTAEIPCDRYIVGVGASAGGLEALEQFFAAVADEPNAIFVVVQHLSPDFESHMDSLLSRKTSLPVKSVEHGMALEENTVYLIPAGKTMILSSGTFLLTEKEKEALSFPIDTFFRSLAQEAQKSSLGIVLSGTGSDGSRGIKNIHDAGGLVLSQLPITCKFDGMPTSAIDTDYVDIVLPPEEMPAVIQKYINKNLSREAISENLPPAVSAGVLGEIFDALHGKFDIDFGQYKPNTITRRIQRRIEINGDPDVEAYAARLSSDASEVEALYHDLLIGVTQFFRDTEAFEHLSNTTIRPIVSEEQTQIRIWVAGCSSGEEAYTIAILVQEELKRQGKAVAVKIFASDVHAQSIRIASEGIYPEQSLTHLSSEQIECYFEKKEDGNYVVSAELRKSIVFTEHNLLTAVPFTNLNLVTCRNLLIYLQPNAQRKVQSFFHFGLKTGGYLMLGPSESLGDLENEFSTIDQHWKIYKKRRDIKMIRNYSTKLSSSKYVATTGDSATTALPSRTHATNSWDMGISDSAIVQTYDSLLDHFMPDGILVDERFRMLHIFANGDKFLRFAKGRASQNLLDLLHDELRSCVSGALQHCVKDQKLVKYSGLKLSAAGEDQFVTVSVRPFNDGKNSFASYFVSFEQSRSGSEVESDEEPSFTHHYRRELELELKYTKENLQATIEELETSNEELQATNEELVASNEELQSSNEELHSVNEELDTVNSEYQKKIKELTELTEDTDNMLEATQIGVVFLDEKKRIRKFTPQISETFRIMNRDLGKDVTSFSHLLSYEGLATDIEEVLEHQRLVESEISLNSGSRFLVKLHPFKSEGKTEEGISSGIVMSVIDITSMHEANMRVTELSDLVSSSSDAIIGFSSTGTILQWNQGAETLYGYSKEEAEGKNAIKLIVPIEYAGDFMEQLEQSMLSDELSPVNVIRVTKDGRKIMVSQRFTKTSDKSRSSVSSIERDITEIITLKGDRDRLANIIEATSDFVGVCDVKGHAELVNPAGLEMIGFDADTDISTLHISEFHPEDVADLIRKEALPSALEHGSWSGDTALKKKNGELIPVSQVVIAHKNETGEPYFSTIIRDMSSEVAAVQQLEDLTAISTKAAQTLRGVIKHFPQILIVVDKELNIEFASPDGDALLKHYGGESWPLGLKDIVKDSIAMDRSYLPLDFDGVAELKVDETTTKYYLRRVNVLHNLDRSVTGAVITLIDVTEFRMLDELKTSLMGTVSHELKNPISGISMALSLVLEESIGQLTAPQKELLQSANQDCKRMGKTIHSLLDLTRFEDGNRTLKRKETTAQEVLAAALEQVRPVAEDAGVELKISTPEKPIALLCDASRLEVAFSNLLTNAIKHTADNGKVEVRVCSDGGKVHFEVMDSGPGIPQEFDKLVFSKFFRVPGNATPGTGLGLNIAKQFVEAHGGKLMFENRLDNSNQILGARFMIVVPQN